MFLPHVTEEDTRRRWGSSSSVQAPLGLAEWVHPPQPSLKGSWLGQPLGAAATSVIIRFCREAEGRDRLCHELRLALNVLGDVRVKYFIV